jgi:hypothetical protein
LNIFKKRLEFRESLGEKVNNSKQFYGKPKEKESEIHKMSDISVP